MDANSRSADQRSQDLLAVARGGHICLIYDNPLEQAQILAPFLRQGLEAGERCIYVADDLTIAQLTGTLAAAGIDVTAETARGALLLWTRDEWRQPGELGSTRKAVQVLRIIEDAIRERFHGVRFAIEMTWTLDPDIDVARLRHWEATLDELLTPEMPVRVSCQYNRNRLNPAVIEAGLATHAIAALGAKTYENPHHAVDSILRGAFQPCIADRTDLDRTIDDFVTAAD